MCLEKLDVTAKVLPCQHTFCKPCLQRIFKAHKELRCPSAGPQCSAASRRCQPTCCSCASWTACGPDRELGERGVLPPAWRADPLGTAGELRLTPRGPQCSPFRLVPNVRIHMDGVRKDLICSFVFPWRLGLCAPAAGASLLLALFQSTAAEDSLRISFCGW